MGYDLEVTRAAGAGQCGWSLTGVDGPGDRDPGGWGFARGPYRVEAWNAMKVVLELMGIDGKRVLKELSLQDP